MGGSEASILIFIAIIFVVLWLRRPGQQEGYETKRATDATFRSFERRPSLFVNKSEFAFFHSLQRNLPKGHFLMSKVRLEDIIGVKSAIKNPDIRWKLRNRVKSRHVDFLIINSSGRAVLAIELDGASHDSGKADNADHLKDGLFKACGIPLERVRTGDNFAEFSQKVLTKLT